MKSTMIASTAFVRQQRNRLYHAAVQQGRCTNHIASTKVVNNNASPVSSIVHRSSVSFLTPAAFHPNRILRCYSTIWGSSLTNGGFNTVVNGCSSTCRYSSAIPQSKYFLHLQPPINIAPSLAISNYYNQQQNRSMGTKKNKESKHQKNKAKQKSMIKKQKLQQEQQKTMRQQQQQQKQEQLVVVGDEHSAITASASTQIANNTKGGAAEQHKEWVEFQKSIEVDGFETGQTLTAIDATKKGRSGGKVATKKRLTKRDEMAEKIKERQRLAGSGGGEFPPMRYSDEETERLLKQAYAAIPKRMGKRGTLQLKRQKRRWHLVREIHRKYKANIVKFHFRRMARRSTKMKQIIDFVSNVAPNTVHQDMEYQNMVRQRYVNMMEAAVAKRAAKLATASANPSQSEHPEQAEKMVESQAA